MEIRRKTKTREGKNGKEKERQTNRKNTGKEQRKGRREWMQRKEERSRDIKTENTCT